MEMNEERKGFETLLPQNRVENFNPNDVLTLVEDVDENGQPAEFLYMEFAASSRWFYTVFPNGRMDYDIVNITDKKAVVRGKVFRDVNDPMPAATSLVSRYYTEDMYGKFYEQNAVTAAYRKALEYLGFGTPPNAVKTENTTIRKKEDIPERGEQGVMIPRPMLPKVESTEANVHTGEPKCKEANPEPVAKKRGRKPGQKATVSTKDTTESHSANTASLTPDTPKSEVLPASKADAATEPKQPSSKMPTIEEALKCLVPYGSLAGKTIEEAAQLKGNDFIRYHCDRARKDSDFYKATTIFCEYRGC